MKNLFPLDPPTQPLCFLRWDCGGNLDALLACSSYLHMVMQLWQKVGYKDVRWLIWVMHASYSLFFW